MICIIFLFLGQFQISEKVPFWNPLCLETLKWFYMEVFKLSKFVLEWTTTKSTIIVLHFCRSLLWQTLPFNAIEQTPHRIVLFDRLHRLFPAKLAGSFLLWCTLWLSVWIQFIKPAIEFVKKCNRAVIKNVGHSGRWFITPWLLVITSSLLCALRLKLRKKIA